MTFITQIAGSPIPGFLDTPESVQSLRQSLERATQPQFQEYQRAARASRQEADTIILD